MGGSLPPLGGGRVDPPGLVGEFASRYADRFGMEGVRLSPELVDALCRADWPGNVRQLENTVARMVALHGGIREIGLEAFTGAPSHPSEPAVDMPAGETLSLREPVDAPQRSILAPPHPPRSRQST